MTSSVLLGLSSHPCCTSGSCLGNHSSRSYSDKSCQSCRDQYHCSSCSSVHQGSCCSQPIYVPCKVAVHRCYSPGCGSSSRCGSICGGCGPGYAVPCDGNGLYGGSICKHPCDGYERYPCGPCYSGGYIRHGPCYSRKSYSFGSYGDCNQGRLSCNLGSDCCDDDYYQNRCNPCCPQKYVCGGLSSGYNCHGPYYIKGYEYCDNRCGGNSCGPCYQGRSICNTSCSGYNRCKPYYIQRSYGYDDCCGGNSCGPSCNQGYNICVPHCNRIPYSCSNRQRCIVSGPYYSSSPRCYTSYCGNNCNSNSYGCGFPLCTGYSNGCPCDG